MLLFIFSFVRLKICILIFVVVAVVVVRASFASKFCKACLKSLFLFVT